MVPNIKVSKFKKDKRYVLFLNDEMGHRHISGAEQCLDTLTEIDIVESRVFKIVVQCSGLPILNAETVWK